MIIFVMTIPRGYMSSASGQASMSDPQGCYYHAVGSYDIPGSKSSIEFDLKCEKIASIIKKYEEFKEFDCKQLTFKPADVAQILIYKTSGTIEVMQSKVTERVNKNSVVSPNPWSSTALPH